MPRLALLAVLAASTATWCALAACSAFDSADTVTAGDASPDGGSDGSQIEPDGGGLPPDDDAGSACPRVFRETFSTNTNPPAGWSTSNVQTNAESSVVSTLPDGGGITTGGNAFRTAVSLSGTGSGELTIIRVHDAFPSELSLSFWMMVTRAELFGEIGCQLRLEENGSDPYVATRYTLVLEPGGDVALATKAFGYSASSAPDVPLHAVEVGVWRRYILRLTIDGQHNATGTIIHGSASPTAVPLEPFAIAPTADRVRVKCGIDYAKAEADGGTTEILIDNVELRACGP